MTTSTTCRSEPPVGLLLDVDPYTGLPVGEHPPGPPVEGIVLREAFEEPMVVEVSDPNSGFLVRVEPAPVFQCMSCGKPTTRRVPIAVELRGPVRNEWVISTQQRAECAACGRRRAEAWPAQGNSLAPWTERGSINAVTSAQTAAEVPNCST